MDEMFQAARAIMVWFGDCAKIIASENETVRWTTPLGLPVVQPYHQMGTKLVKTPLQTLSLQRETDKVIVRRQRTAFPPICWITLQNHIILLSTHIYIGYF